MKRLIVVGLQWGDEGKGKVVDLLSQDAEYVVRGQGGSNAGHTIVNQQGEFKLHQVPSGILSPNTQCIIGAGCVLDPVILADELHCLKSQGIEVAGRLHISPYVHLVSPYHRMLDQASEQKKGGAAIGTTGRGIGPCYRDKAARSGVRLADLLWLEQERSHSILSAFEKEKRRELAALYGEEPAALDQPLLDWVKLYVEPLREYVSEVEHQLSLAVKAGKKILFEGANGSFLDIGFGTYPYVTSSHTLSGGVALGAGVGPTAIEGVLGIAKAYSTRVGAGPFPTEFESQSWDCSAVREVGTTTGRDRRIGALDLVMLKRAVALNGVTHLALTKLDILDHQEKIQVCTAYRVGEKESATYSFEVSSGQKVEPCYREFEGWMSTTEKCRSFEQLPEKAQQYVRFIEEFCEVPVSLVSVGPGREQGMWKEELPFQAKEKSE